MISAQIIRRETADALGSSFRLVQIGMTDIRDFLLQKLQVRIGLVGSLAQTGDDPRLRQLKFGFVEGGMQGHISENLP